MTKRCVLFDMDGTLYDSGIDFLAIRKRLGLPQDGRPILEQLQQESPDAQSRGIALLHAAEAEGAANGKLLPGTTALLSWLRASDIRCGLITNNSRKSVEAVLASHPLKLDLILTRDDAATKPAPDLFLLALEKLECRARDAVAVGDTHLDALAAHRAGIREIYLIALRNWMQALLPADIPYKHVENLAQVHARIETWLKKS